MSNNKHFLVRGLSGFVRVWGHEVLDLYQDDPDYEILGRDLSAEEAVALAKLANIEIVQKLERTNR